MFWKIGFFVLLALLIFAAWIFMKANPMKNEGASSWVEIYSATPDDTIKFLSDTFGIKHIKTMPSAMPNMDYKIIKAKGQMWPFAGVMGLPELSDGQRVFPQSMIYLTVKDYDASHDKMIAHGATVVMSHVIADGMKFGIYAIPGGLDIGISQYEHVKTEKKN